MVRRVGSRGPGQPVRQGARFPGTLPAPLPPSLPASTPPGWEEEAAGCKHTSGPLNPACTFPANLCSPAKIAPGSTGRWHSNINGAPGPPSKCHFPEKCTEPPPPLPFPGIPLASEPGPTGPFPPESQTSRRAMQGSRAQEAPHPNLAMPDAKPAAAKRSPWAGPVTRPRSRSIPTQPRQEVSPSCS